MPIETPGVFDDKTVRVLIRIDVAAYYIDKIYAPHKEKNGASHFRIKIDDETESDPGFTYVVASSNHLREVDHFSKWCERFPTMERIEEQRKELAEYEKKREEREIKGEDKLDIYERHFKPTRFSKSRRY